MSAPLSNAASVRPARPLTTEYAFVAAILAVTIGALVWATRPALALEVPPADLLRPVFAMVLLTAAVWLSMAVVRNASVMRGITSARYYEAYTGQAPPDWVERPARTFNNLMQIPMLFYALCALLLATGHVDGSQVLLAWLFVTCRVAHALVYMLVNRVSVRFATYVAGCITLGVMWTRFALATL